jgi:hypothetical protein
LQPSRPGRPHVSASEIDDIEAEMINPDPEITAKPSPGPLNQRLERVLAEFDAIIAELRHDPRDVDLDAIDAFCARLEAKAAAVNRLWRWRYDTKLAGSSS